jgi:single-strand DNA-binding protein
VASYNRIILVGNLTRDPELTQISTGQAVCRLSLASNRQFKNKAGVATQEVCYIDVEVWGPQAESCNKYLQKGRPVLIEGRLKLNTWKEADGQQRSRHIIVADRVIFLASSQGAELSSFEGLEETANSAVPAPGKQAKASIPEITFKDEPPFGDDLPF